MGAETPPARGHAWRPYHALALLPTLGMLGGLPFANRVEPLMFGLPFLMAWLVAWVLTTSAIMALILWLDRANGLVTDETTGDGVGRDIPDGSGAAQEKAS